ncbi:hypothetical protein Dimus_004641 [Dionaea muscipula]
MAVSSSPTLCKFLLPSSASNPHRFLPQKTQIPFPLSPPACLSLQIPKSNTRNGLIPLMSRGCNVEVVADDDEPEDEVLSRFRREVWRAGIIQECKRRRFFESTQEKKKRKHQEAIRKRSWRRRQQPIDLQEEEAKKAKRDWYDFDGDNWEILPDDSELPYGLGSGG